MRDAAAKAQRDRKQKNTAIVLLVIIAAMAVIFTVASDTFLTRRNTMNLMRQTAETGMIVITVALLVISRDIDVSMGSAIGLCCISLGLILHSNIPIPLALLLVVAIGAIIGSFNGVLIAMLKLPGMVATTGTSILLRGLCYVFSKGYPVSGFDDAFLKIGRIRYFNLIPLSFLLMVLIAAAAHLLMEKSSFGLRIRALGSNPRTAVYSGIRVAKNKLLLCVLNGAVIGFASFFLLARMGSAEATTGQGFDLDILASCLLGGLSLSGGKGNISTVFLGLMGIGIMRNGLNQLSMPSIYQEIILGGVIALNAANWVREKRQ